MYNTACFPIHFTETSLLQFSFPVLSSRAHLEMTSSKALMRINLFARLLRRVRSSKHVRLREMSVCFDGKKEAQ